MAHMEGMEGREDKCREEHARRCLVPLTPFKSCVVVSCELYMLLVVRC